ncbi:leucine-rich repeat domain-containing protein [Capnocytophaga periodontitidis]|jgi:surface antigen bspA|uniref:leucine-rich repeat domain-containing protein n=1 Tax=Capnocytophaga periodontitidis TaxID=2795027 RepID=UPI0018E15CAB|nr:leucine-rich repeat domain-containing protein [Capnocytophaga periodontitidis]MBI1667908.1 leucine-rich repeat protein [Capnocytophaga periodontitidis]
MKKIFFLVFITIALAACSKSNDDSANVPETDYQLSADGLTLVKWLNPLTSGINMQADSRLREVNTIGEKAFKDCSRLQSVIFPDNLKEINTEAFAGTDLRTSVVFNSYSDVVFGERVFSNTRITSITLPKTKELSAEIFANCTALKNITFAKTGKIGRGAFKGCTAIEQIDLSQAEAIAIGAETFAGCKRLKKVILSVTMNLKPIGDKAFANCESLENLTVLALYPPYFEGNPFQGISYPTVYVPATPDDLIDIYKRDSQWKALADKIHKL